MYCSLLQI